MSHTTSDQSGWSIAVSENQKRERRGRGDREGGLANLVRLGRVDMSDSEKEDAGRSSPISSRHEKSLGLLTAKFVEMLKNAEGGLLDLKKVPTPTASLRV